MKLRNPMLTAAAMFLAAGAVSCSSDLTGPAALSDAQISADVAVASGDAVASNVAGFTDNVAAAGSFTMVAPSYSINAPGYGTSGQPSFGTVASNCTYTAPRYTCTATTENGLAVVRSFAFYDASGATLQTFDSTKVESVNFQAKIDGTFLRDVWTAAVHRTRNHTVSGLISLKPKRKWNGVGSSTDTLSNVGLDGTRTIAGTSVETVTNVLMPGKAAASQIPLSGTVMVAANYTATLQTASGSTSKQVTRQVLVTFDGTVTPKLAIGALICTLHLDTHRVDGCQ
jgi:hypothetical protein